MDKELAKEYSNMICDWLESHPAFKVIEISNLTGIDSGNLSRYIRLRTIPKDHIPAINCLLQKYGYDMVAKMGKGPKTIILPSNSPEGRIITVKSTDGNPISVSTGPNKTIPAPKTEKQGNPTPKEEKGKEGADTPSGTHRPVPPDNLKGVDLAIWKSENWK